MSSESDQKKNGPNYHKKQKRPKAVFVMIGVLLILLVPFSIRQTRVWLCDETNICFHTCKEYSGNPIEIKINTGKPWTCEEMEFLKQQEFSRSMKSFFGFEKKKRKFSSKTYTAGEVVDPKNKETKNE